MDVGFEAPDFVAVRQEYKLHVELLSLVASLMLRLNGMDVGTHGLDPHRARPGRVAERVIDPLAVGQGVLEEDTRSVRQAPAGILEDASTLTREKRSVVPLTHSSTSCMCQSDALGKLVRFDRRRRFGPRGRKRARAAEPSEGCKGRDTSSSAM